MHYGHKRMSFEKDVAIQMRDCTVLYANVFRPSDFEDNEVEADRAGSYLHLADL